MTAQRNQETVRQRANEMATRQDNTLVAQLEKLIPQLARALPQHMSADKMARIITTEVRKNPNLALCDAGSFFGSVFTACQLGLEPGPQGLAYLIPYKQKVTLQIGYRGLLELVNRSGQVDTVYAYPVYEGDLFKYRLGIHILLEHEPCGENDPKKLTHVYAVAKLKGSPEARVEVMNRDQVDEIRKRSQAVMAGRSTPWDTDYAEMARKTVLKRLCKTLPMSTELRNAIAMDETVRDSIEVDPTSVFDMDIPVEPMAQPEPEVSNDPAPPEAQEVRAQDPADPADDNLI